MLNGAITYGQLSNIILALGILSVIIIDAVVIVTALIEKGKK